jgi:formylglycine-generating enzyme required for sulfatase activity
MNHCLKLGLALIGILSMLSLPSAMALNNQRAALIIGNATYKTSPLANPANDANDMATLLKKLGFNVTKLTNAGRRDMEEAINALGRRLKKGGTGLFYFAGHGVQVEGINYLIPIGARIETEGDVKFEAVNANRVLSKMQDAGNPLNMVFLDACRNNPFARMFRSAQQGLAPMDAPKGSLVAFATAPGDTAADGRGRNGVFTKHLLRHIPQAGLEVGPMMRQVRAGVQADTDEKQTPFEVSSLTGSFYFNTASGAPSTPTLPPPSVTLPPQPPGATTSGIGDYEAVFEKRQAAMDKWTAWQNAMASEFDKAEALCQKPLLWPKEKADIWGRFLATYGDGNPYSDRDEVLRERAKNEQNKWASQKGQMLAMGSRPKTMDNKSLSKSLGINFVYIEPGTFKMGSPSGWFSGEKYRNDDETQHSVTLTRGYHLQTTEVTQSQWKAVMGSNPSRSTNCGDDCPVEQVSWNDVQDFIKKLNQKEGGDRYRLPTEAEWEYAARAGTTTVYSWGNEADCDKMMYENDVGSNENKCVSYHRNRGLTPDSTAPVKSFSPNAWGLYDMHGNVWEWCQDWKGAYPSGAVTDPTGPSGGTGRVRRGGSWDDDARDCRSADRSSNDPGYRGNYLGFRLLKTP